MEDMRLSISAQSTEKSPAIAAPTYLGDRESCSSNGGRFKVGLSRICGISKSMGSLLTGVFNRSTRFWVPVLMTSPFPLWSSFGLKNIPHMTRLISSMTRWSATASQDRLAMRSFDTLIRGDKPEQESPSWTGAALSQ
jgi:hypothetical protein